MTPTGPPTSPVLFCGQPSFRDSLDEFRVVALALVGVELGEVGHGVVEALASAEVGGYRDAIARARVGPRQGRAADLSVEIAGRCVHGVDVGGGLLVPELADVEVALAAVGSLGADPAEEDVAPRLHQPLSLDHPLALVLERAALRERLEYRALSLLDLEEEGILGRAPEQEDYPGAGADAPHADDLARQVHV